MLLALLLGILAFLWMLDALFTVQVLEKKGNKKEANRLARSIYGRGVFSFIAFKLTVLVFVLAGLLMASGIYTITAESVAFIFIYIYASVDRHNYKIWRNRNGNSEETKKKRI